MGNLTGGLDSRERWLPRRAFRVTASVALGAALALAPAAALAATAHVDVDDNFYSPATVTIEQGDSVSWTNVGQNQHTVTANGGAFDSGTMNPGASFSHTFQSAGTFAYFCQVHGQAMSGTVVVRGPGGEVPGGPSGLASTGGAPIVPLVVGAAMFGAGVAAILWLRRGRNAG